MSLIDEAMQSYYFMEKSRTSDGYGGYKTTYTQGASFDGAMTFDMSIESRRAQADGVKNTYTLFTRKSVTLDYHDIIKRASDSKIFRITSDGEDKKTPASAGIDLRSVSCEEYTL